MPSIAQQDYIVIDWEDNDKDSMPAEKLNSIKTQLKRIADSNPNELFSVIFKDYAGCTGRILSYNIESKHVVFFDDDGGAMTTFSYSLA